MHISRNTRIKNILAENTRTKNTHIHIYKKMRIQKTHFRIYTCHEIRVSNIPILAENTRTRNTDLHIKKMRIQKYPYIHI